MLKVFSRNGGGAGVVNVCATLAPSQRSHNSQIQFARTCGAMRARFSVCFCTYL